MTNLHALNDVIVIKNYGNYPGMYEVTEIRTYRSPQDTMLGEDDCQENFLTYYKEKYDITITDTKQPLLLVKKVSKRHNMLCCGADYKSVDDYNGDPTSKIEVQTVSNNTAPSACIGDKTENTSQKITELIPELCSVYFIPASEWKIFTCVPCFLWRVESLLLASELKDVLMERIEINDLETSKNLSFTMNLLKAITLAQAQDSISLERLEFLGDSLLKYIFATYLFISHPKWHEGQLTQKLSELISNSKLYERGESFGISKYIIGESFNPLKNDTWIPPGYHVQVNTEDLDGRKLSSIDGCGDNAVIYQNFRRKSIADVMEAILAVILLELGLKSAMKFIFLLYDDFHGQFKTYAPSSPVNDNAINIYKTYSLHQLEEKIGYSFRDKSVLICALTHSSYHHNDIVMESNQKLEFLGDAILSHIVARYFFDHRVKAKPAELHDLQEAIVNNAHLAVIGLAINIEKYLFHESQQLLKEIKYLEDILEDEVCLN